MADNTVRFLINIDGNAYSGVVNLDDAFKNLTASVKTSLSFTEKFTKSLIGFNMFTDALTKVNEGLQSAIQPGITFDHSLRELSAIAQVTGKPLEEIADKARNLAKTFGGDATSYVESFKDVIGSLGDTFSDSTALDMMGENIATLSKLMGGDAKAAASALTTAMLQYGVDLSDPIAASAEATRMMNVMQAAANVGGSEVSDTAEALRQAGLLARQSGLSFEELNASLEGLAKGKIVAGEAGTAMRNILLSMSTLETAPKTVAEGLAKYGVNVALVADPTAKFTDRLRELSKIQGDAGLMESVFMKANIAAGQTILGNIDVIDRWTESVTGTNAAVEGAATIMESFQERQARIEAKFNDMKIALFNATGDLGIWTATVSSSLIPMAQMAPLLIGMGRAMMFVKAMSVWKDIQLLNLYLASGEIVAATFGQKMLQAAVSLVRFGTVGIFNAIKGVGALIISLITGGATSVKFAAISSTAFGAFATSAKVACRAVTVAIGSIPIIGWIAIAITALGALFVWLYKKFDGFRAFINGIGAALKAIFTGDWGNIGKSFTNAYEKTLADAKKANEKADKDDPALQMSDLEKQLQEQATGKGTEINLSQQLNNTATTAAGDNRIRNINITIDRVIDKFTVSSTTLKESTAKIRELVAQAIIEGVNDVNLAF